MIDLSKPLPQYVVLLDGFSDTPPTGTVLSINERCEKPRFEGWGAFHRVKDAVKKYPKYFSPLDINYQIKKELGL